MRHFFHILILCFLCVTAADAAIIPVLSDSDIQAYRRILQAQEGGDIRAARTLAEKLADDSLMGYVLYHRYFSKSYSTRPAEITAWLEKYDTLPVAPEMYALGVQKKARLPAQRPKGIFGGKSGACSHIFRPEPIDLITGLAFPQLSGETKKQAQKLIRQIRRYLQSGKTLNARQLIESPEAKKLLPLYEHDAARTALAFSYFLDGADEKALELARQALKKSAKQLPLASWTAGLASWRQGDIAAAARYFEAAALHRESPDLLKASASFWTARAYLKLGAYEKVGNFLEAAARHRRLFYGLLAMRLLAQDLDNIWNTPTKASDEIRADFSHPALTRFYALKQIGRDAWAQEELSHLYLGADAEAKSVLLMISQQNGFAEDLLGVAGNLSDDDTRYPAPNWTPRGGWQADKALVFAFVRQESCFNSRAESAAGALGLMQIMPKTGRELASLLRFPWRSQNLKEPAYNLALGQAYLLQLMANPEIQKNLIFTAVAYNAGPGNLARWKKRMRYQDDPLLFLESIPSKETRSFAERILANYWIYRSLMGQPLDSLDAIAQGRWPLYSAFDN